MAKETSNSAPNVVLDEDESATAENFSWPPLESNPDVFTEYLRKIGLPQPFAIGEVFGFDEDLLAFLPQPTLGTIVCYERLKKAQDKEKGSPADYGEVEFYMHQSGALDNACGIIACLHAALNSTAVAEISPSTVLGNFRERTAAVTPAERCAALENDEDFKTIHKGYASRGQSQEITSDQSNVRHHFIAYVLNSKGKLVELDGTKKGPVVLGDCGGDVLRGSISEIKRKLEQGEISESLNMMTLHASQD